MNIITKKSLCLVLASCMLICTLSLPSCSDNGGKLSLKDKYTVVVGKELALCESDAPNTLADALKTEGVSASVENDVDTPKGDHEILIGLTDREESKQAYDNLDKIDDFIIDPISQNVIVICGKSPRATEAAVNYFLSEYLRAGKNEFEGELFIKSKSIYRQEYQYDSVKLEGVALSDYVIAARDETFIKDAYEVAYLLGAYSGEFARVVDNSQLTDAHKSVICVGSNGRNVKRPYPKDLDGYHIGKEVDKSGVTISILWSHSDYKEDAFEALTQRFIVKGDEKVTDAKFTPITSHDQKNLDAVNAAEWVVESSIERPVADGVTQVSYTCKGYEDMPYLVHVMTVDLKKADLILGTADNRNDVPDEWTQTPLQHANAAEKAGYTVLGATNGGGSVGMSIKEGVMMVPQGNLNRPFFAINNDGEPVIGPNEQKVKAQDYQLFTAGTYMIVNNYMPGDLKTENEASYTPHPRTLIGIRGDGTIVMVVIDGRQPELSNGAPLVRCADIMMKLGCKYALNLDGGGSSTMFVKNPNGEFDVVNKISDPTMRPVRNSILVVAKKDQPQDQEVYYEE